MTQQRVMVTGDDKAIGAPAVPESRRDRISVWIAEHSWVLPIIRIAGGLGLVAVAVLGFGLHHPLAKLVIFVIGALSGGEAGEREKERGDTLLDAILAGGDPPEPPEPLPREFDEFVPRPPDPRGDDRYFGRR